VKVEGFHFDQRKRLVEYDDVANQQREIIYGLRRRVLESEDVSQELLEKLHKQVGYIMETSWPEHIDRPDYDKMAVELAALIPFDDASREAIKKQLSKINDKVEIEEQLQEIINKTHKSREGDVGKNIMRQIEKQAYLRTIDHLWIDYIDHIDGLREGVMLRAYGQRDPLVEFKNEAFNLFENLLDKIDEEVSQRIFRVQVVNAGTGIPLQAARTNVDESDGTGLIDESADTAAVVGEPAFAKAPGGKPAGDKAHQKIGRNDPCWCGSGKKWKKCHYPQVQS
jgi:preprotein translocase subunit SecA